MDTSFRFNFGENNDNGKENCTTEGEACCEADDGPNDSPCSSPTPKEYILTTNCHALTSMINKASFSTHCLGKTTNRSEKVLFYRSNDTIDNLFQQHEDSEISDKLLKIVQHSDLNSGVYEGGFKVWECSLDLVEFLHENDVELLDKDTLEIGCGAGLPGIYCLLSGARSLCLQDFNTEVIECFTVHNVVCNVAHQMGISQSSNNNCLQKVVNDVRTRCMFLSGSWEASNTYLQQKGKTFDVILSSETIYNPNCYPALHALVCTCMKRGGIALFANKSYYFGVGGSTKEFVDFVNEKGVLKAELALQIPHGVKRDIIKLTWK